MPIEANAMALAFEKRKFYCEVDQKETGGMAQVCLSDLGFSQTLVS